VEPGAPEGCHHVTADVASPRQPGGNLTPGVLQAAEHAGTTDVLDEDDASARRQLLAQLGQRGVEVVDAAELTDEVAIAGGQDLELAVPRPHGRRTKGEPVVVVHQPLHPGTNRTCGRLATRG
jgi:hypothetical protein